MKNRKIILISFLVCACIVVGVGYANLADDLIVEGHGKLTKSNAEVEFQKDIYFSQVVSRTNCTAVIDATDTSNDKIAITIDDTTSKMAVQGDKATVELQIANATLDEATVTLDFQTNAPEKYFSLSCSESSAFTVPAGTEGVDTIDPGLKTITVTITLEKTINADMADYEAFKLVLNAVSGSAT